MKLTALQVKQAKPKENDYKLFDGEGLFLLVKKNGNKHWRLKYRFLGKEKLLALGSYPLFSLQDAREAKMEAKKLIAEGVDPVVHKQNSKVEAIRNVQNTFQAIALEWYENRKDIWNPRYADEVLKRLNEDIFPYIGKMPIKDIEPPLLLEVIKKIERRGALELSRRQLQKCGEIFRYAIASGRVERDPSNDIKEALKPVKKEHYASIDIEELPEFIDELKSNRARLHPTTHNALWLIMLTFVRTSELINARWEEIDFNKNRWVIPAQRMKMSKEHIVPLADQAVEILKKQEQLTGQWNHVFPSPVKPQKSISNNTILGALKRMGYQGRMTGHGFRSLAMGVVKQELGYRHEVVDRQLAHTPKNKIDKAYDRASFLEERAIMMQDWANYLDTIAKDGTVKR